MATASDLIKDGWFGEAEAMWPGQRMMLQLQPESKVLVDERSDFQDIIVFDSRSYGRVLVLDGVIQLTERDECAYQEMIAHLPLFAHPNPKSVLIVGGGDGGVLREVCRHQGVSSITQCDIDGKVIEVAKQYFGKTLATSFDDERLNLVIGDAAEFLKQPDQLEKYDVIIVDSSDPVGPADALFQAPFQRSLQNALKPGGVVCSQGECLWLHLPLIKQLMHDAGSLYSLPGSAVDYAFTTVPTYPSGQIGFLLCAKAHPNRQVQVRTPSRPVPPNMQSQLRYYSQDIHRAAFVLPKFAEDVLREKRIAPASRKCCTSKICAVALVSATIALGAWFVSKRKR